MNEQKDWKDGVGDFLQGLADLIDRMGEPLFSLIAVTVPFIAPVVIAQITATALVFGGILNQSQANQLALVLEGIGIVGLAGLVVAIDKWIKSNNEKMDAMILLLGTIDLVYFLFLVFVNVLLDRSNPNITTTQLVIKAIICLVPLMAGGIYGYYRIVNKEKIARNDAKKESYVIRQEQREDRIKSKMIKQGMNPTSLVYSYDTPVIKNNSNKTDWRELTKAERQSCRNMSAEEIMKLYDVGESTAFRWKKNSKSE